MDGSHLASICDIPPFRGMEHSSFIDAWYIGLKGKTEVRESPITHKVLLSDYTCGMEIPGILVVLFPPYSSCLLLGLIPVPEKYCPTSPWLLSAATPCLSFQSANTNNPWLLVPTILIWFHSHPATALWDIHKSPFSSGFLLHPNKIHWYWIAKRVMMLPQELSILTFYMMYLPGR